MISYQHLLFVRLVRRYHHLIQWVCHAWWKHRECRFDVTFSGRLTFDPKVFFEEVFGCLDLDWNDYVEIDPRYFRPTEVDLLLGDATKARKVLNWQPKVDMKQLAKMMVDADMNIAENEKVIRDHRNAQ